MKETFKFDVPGVSEKNESPWNDYPWNELTPEDYEMLFKTMYGTCAQRSEGIIEFIALLRAMKQSANFMASSKEMRS